MKYLTDSDIIRWNNRLNKSIYSITPRYSTRNGYPDIIISEKIESGLPGMPLVKSGIEDPIINYSFSFSVVSHRKDEFFEILHKLLKEKFDTKLLTISNSPESSVGRKHNFDYLTQDYTNIRDIILDEEILGKYYTQNHKILNRTFIKYTYDFNNRLTDIICTLSYIEDTIEFFQLIWGYDEEGNEICLLDFPVGSVVSKNNDKSKDFLVIEYLYKKVNSKFNIEYIVSEIIYDSKSPIIKYGESFIINKDEICHSRNNRIDNILN
jgi:hypothetical protein